MPDLPLLDVVRHILHTGNNIADQPLPLSGCHQPEETARLCVVITVKPGVVAVHGARDGPGSLGPGGLFSRTFQAVRLIISLPSGVASDTEQVAALSSW